MFRTLIASLCLLAVNAFAPIASMLAPIALAPAALCVARVRPRYY